MNPAPKQTPREPRSLLFYLLYAAGMHALVLVLAGFIKHQPPPPPPPDETLIEFVQPEAPEPEKPQPIKEEPKPEPTEAPAPAPRRVEKFVPRAVEPPPQAVQEQTIADELATVDNPNSPEKSWVPPTRTTEPPKEDVPVVPQKTLSSAFAGAIKGRQGGFGRSTGSAVGTGDGPAGLGSLGKGKSSLPMVSGVGVFGSGKKGALKGSLCFIPQDTRSLTQVTRCTAVGIMYTNALNISKRRFTSGFPGVDERFEWFALDYVGKFTVKTAGNYTFRIASDDGSLVWVNGKLLINNDGLHPLQSKANAIELEAGSHKIRVLYYQGPRVDIALQLFVTPPGEQERLWGPEL